MNKAKDILNKINEVQGDQFKSGDFVVYLSAQGPQYHCFAKVIDYTKDGKVLIRLLLKLDGRQEIDDVSEDNGTKEVNEYSLQPGREMLAKKIETGKMKLARLEELQREVG